MGGAMSNGKKEQPMDFEQALAELEGIVERMEGGEQTLDQTMQDFERGMELSQQCRKSLDGAQLKVEQLVRKYDQYDLEPVDAQPGPADAPADDA